MTWQSYENIFYLYEFPKSSTSNKLTKQWARWMFIAKFLEIIKIYVDVTACGIEGCRVMSMNNGLRTNCYLCTDNGIKFLSAKSRGINRKKHLSMQLKQGQVWFALLAWFTWVAWCIWYKGTRIFPLNKLMWLGFAPIKIFVDNSFDVWGIGTGDFESWLEAGTIFHNEVKTWGLYDHKWEWCPSN